MYVTLYLNMKGCHFTEMSDLWNAKCKIENRAIWQPQSPGLHDTAEFQPHSEHSNIHVDFLLLKADLSLPPMSILLMDP